jgi:hypothetical protein
LVTKNSGDTNVDPNWCQYALPFMLKHIHAVFNQRSYEIHLELCFIAPMRCRHTADMTLLAELMSCGSQRGGIICPPNIIRRVERGASSFRRRFTPSRWNGASRDKADAKANESEDIAAKRRGVPVRGDELGRPGSAHYVVRKVCTLFGIMRRARR